MSAIELSYCSLLNTTSIVQCHSYDGVYCETYKNLIVENTTEVKTKFNCTNTAKVVYCPSGYYCTDGNKYECQSGYYCPSGFDHQRGCLYTLANCSKSGLSKQDEVITLIIGTVILTACIILIKTVANIIYYDQYASRQEEFDHIEQQQALYLKTKQNLVRHITTKLSTKTNFEFKSISFDQEECTKNTKESVTDINTISYKLSNKVLDNVTNLSKNIHKKVEKFINLFEYRKIEEPIFVSFVNMNLNLKQNNKPILSNICASFRPFEVTAIMGYMNILCTHAIYIVLIVSKYIIKF
jgi:hypothetical protein